jgi:hypothetical protein
VSDIKSLGSGLTASRRPSDLAPFPSSAEPADGGYQPFGVQLLSRGELAALAACGLIERGASARSAVGDSGYRLTRRGWEVVALLWYDRGPPAPEIAPVIPAG